MQDGEWTEERKEHSGENHGRDDDKTSERERIRERTMMEDEIGCEGEIRRIRTRG